MNCYKPFPMPSNPSISPDFGSKHTGKVRDIYTMGDQRMLITTDRVSAFDRVLGVIPFKGQVLNQLSAWWFDQTRDIVANHLISAPDPNLTIAHSAETLPVEVIVRGYITGVTIHLAVDALRCRGSQALRDRAAGRSA